MIMKSEEAIKELKDILSFLNYEVPLILKVLPRGRERHIDGDRKDKKRLFTSYPDDLQAAAIIKFSEKIKREDLLDLIKYCIDCRLWKFNHYDDSRIRLVNRLLNKIGSTLNEDPWKEKFLNTVKTAIPRLTKDWSRIMDENLAKRLMDRNIKAVEKTGITKEEYFRSLKELINSEEVIKEYPATVLILTKYLKLPIQADELLKSADYKLKKVISGFYEEREMMNVYKILSKDGTNIQWRKNLIDLF